MTKERCRMPRISHIWIYLRYMLIKKFLVYALLQQNKWYEEAFDASQFLASNLFGKNDKKKRRPEKDNSKFSTTLDKVHIFWEGHKILRNLHQLFDWQYIGQIIGRDFVKFLWPSQNIWTLSKIPELAMSGFICEICW